MRTWHFSVGGVNHTVQVAHDPLFSGELEIYIDGHEVENTVIPGGKDYEHPFNVEGKPGKVRILFEGMSVNYDVQVEGKTQPYSGAEDLVLPSASPLHMEMEDRVSPPDSSFHMEIEDIFVVKGSVVVTGTVAVGRIEPGDDITISGDDQNLNATVVKIQIFAKSLPVAEAGDSAGLMVEGVERSQISSGMHIRLAKDSPVDEVNPEDHRKQGSAQVDGDHIEGERVSERPKDASVICADCQHTLIWNDAFKCTDTPGAAQHTSSEGDYLPRAFCPHCGALIIEWHITKAKDFDTWRWFGQNEELNQGQPLPPAAIVHGWGVSIPPQFVPSYDLHRLDVDAIRSSAATSAAPPDSEVARAIEMVPGVDPRTADLETALFMAADHGVTEAVDILLNAGANPNFKAPTGWTPLLQAAKNGHADAVRALLANGADSNNQNVFAAHTPLILATLGKHIEVVKVLLEAGADVGRHNQWGVTALRNAQGHEVLEKMLRDAGAEI